METRIDQDNLITNMTVVLHRVTTIESNQSEQKIVNKEFKDDNEEIKNLLHKINNSTTSLRRDVDLANQQSKENKIEIENIKEDYVTREDLDQHLEDTRPLIAWVKERMAVEICNWYCCIYRL